VYFHRSLRRTSLAALGLTGAAGLSLSLSFPALAQTAIKTFQTVTCSLATACILGENSSTGPGVTGKSTNGFGVQGNGITGLKGVATKNYGVNGTSAFNYGVFGTSTAEESSGVAGTTPSSDGSGVYGYTTSSTGGIGVEGLSKTGYGLYGAATQGGGYGVVGQAQTDGIGVFGGTDAGDGVDASSNSGTALYAQALGGTAGDFESPDGGYGVIANANGSVALYGNNANGNGSDIEGTYIGIIGRAPASGGFPLVATDQNSNDLFFVDGAGNVSYSGGLFHFAKVGGALVKSFSPNTTQPTVEDTGTAQLAGGAAAVRLDPTFAASIDVASSYRVFLTPDGDTRGLYVATKTASGFIVRESQGGRSTVGFDYRIVATAAGQAGQRMAVASLASGPRATRPTVARRQAVRPAPPLQHP
jgi:hypothetical protein